jgi:hypothetical protein
MAHATAERPSTAARRMKSPRSPKPPGAIRRRLGEAWWLVRAPFARFSRRIRRRRLRHSGVDRPRRWWARPTVLILTIFIAVLALIFIAWLFWSVYIYFSTSGKSSDSLSIFRPDSRCSNARIGVSCGAVTGFFTSLLSVAFASGIFLFFRFYRVMRRYRGIARKNARILVPTAGSIVGTIVGRDELCRVIMADLHDRNNRRPHVLIGGVGTGKTAVLVRLTELLATRHAVPVPIRLREASKNLDFEELAQRKFMEELSQYLLSKAEGERIWRRLLRDGRIVVLADGLEEALSGENMEYERDNLIRLAISRACEQRLGLIIASRPHDPLRGMKANISDLEPLSEEAALAYIGEGEAGQDELRLDWIIEKAEVAEAPLYMQITRSLYRTGLLMELFQGRSAVIDMRSVDRATVRLGLLRAYEKSIIERRLYRDVPLKQSERHAAIEWLSALACIGLMNDSLEVGFSDDETADDSLKGIIDETKEKLNKIGKNVDTRLAAIWGSQLGLVETRDSGVRFQHSIMQAYLGSRLMDTAMRIPEYRREALGTRDLGQRKRHRRPGREFLIALVLHSRRGCLRAANGTGSAVDRRAMDPITPEEVTCHLHKAADGRDDIKALDILAAALEIGSVAGNQPRSIVAEKIERKWRSIHTADVRSLDEIKFGIVRRFGDAASPAIDGSRTRTGGKAGVFRRTRGMLSNGDCQDSNGNGDRPGRRFSMNSRMGGRLLGTANPDQAMYARLYRIGRSESSYPLQLAVAELIGGGGEEAYQDLADKLAVPRRCQMCVDQRKGNDRKRKDTVVQSVGQALDDESRRAGIISAWLAPLLVGSSVSSVEGDRKSRLRRNAERDLEQWVRHVGQDDRRDPEERELTIPEEIALAQGFKLAANRRLQHHNSPPETQIYLADQALRMLKRTSYWFSQLTLMHALTLWQLPNGNPQTFRGKSKDPNAIVDKWLNDASRPAPSGAGANGRAKRPLIHPFVEAAAKLCARALETRHPERYIWIDESGVIGRVGSRLLTDSETAVREHHLWIPPSTGWSALDRRAQQLVADVLLLQNLAEGTSGPNDVDRRLDRANRSDLPLCLTQDRTPLEPRRTVGMADSPGTRRRCASGCPFELCPYPPIGAKQERVELDEAFCRRQRTLLRRGWWWRSTRWQGISARRLRRFWGDMADRARASRPGADSDTGTG